MLERRTLFFKIEHIIKTVLSEAVARRCSVNNAFKKYVFLKEKHQFRSLCFDKVNRAYFQFLVLEVIPSEAAVYKCLQSSRSEKVSKINRKTLAMEFSFIEVGDCNFIIKEFHP